MYDFLSSVKNKRKEEDILKYVGNQTVHGSHWLQLYRRKKILWKSLATINCTGMEQDIILFLGEVVEHKENRQIR